MDYLFSKYDLTFVLQNQIGELRGYINNLEEDYILNVSEADLTTFLKDKYSIEPITLGEPFIASSGEADIDVSHQPWRASPFHDGPVYVKGMTVRIRVPYTGDGQLFFCTPSQFTLSPPQGIVADNHLEFVMTGERLSGENVKRELDNALREIQGYLTHHSNA
jgi:hypothetical protein